MKRRAIIGAGGMIATLPRAVVGQTAGRHFLIGYALLVGTRNARRRKGGNR